MDQVLAPGAPNYDVDGRVRPPGIAMMIAGGVFALLTMGGGALYAALFGFAAIAPKSPSSASSSQDETIALAIFITLIVVGVAVMLVLYGLIIFGGWSLMNRRRYAFALTGSVLTLLAGVPCSCIPVNTLVFLPIGIWSLIVLMDPGVKDSFGA